MIRKSRFGTAATAVLIATLGSSFAAGTAVAQGLPTLPAVFAGGEVGSGIYIDAAYLATLSTRPNFKLLDVRSAQDYAAGHIPGAISVPNASLNESRNGLSSEVRSSAELEAVFAAAGLSYDDIIVIYGDVWVGKSFIAFDQSGFENVHILDGSVSAWSGPLSTQATVPTPSDFQLTRAKFDIVTKEYVLDSLSKPDVFIIDSRTESAFNQGYIPGSYNFPYPEFVDGATLQPIDQLVAFLESIGVTHDSEIISTCGAGPAASDLLTVLRDLGYTNIRLYDGSWQEWVLDPDTPKATVAATTG